MIEIKKLSEDRGYPDFNEKHPIFQDDDRRDSSGFITCDEDSKLWLLVPYDSGVCYRKVDLEHLIDFLFGEFDPPNWITDRLHGMLVAQSRLTPRNEGKPYDEAGGEAGWTAKKEDDHE